MAELPQLGTHCQVPGCNLLDFLPFECPDCSKIFCQQHRSPDAHNCSKCNVPNVPQADCALPLFRKCSVAQCTAPGSEVVVCHLCNANVCLKHRHSWDHQCIEKVEEPKTVSKTEEHVNKILASKAQGKTPGPAKAPPSAKASKMAAKLALMKLKMKAEGDKYVLLENRVHLNVYLPKQCGQSSKPLYFYKEVKVGKVIDKICDKLNILYKINSSNGAEKNVALFSHTDGHRLAVEKSLEDLVNSEEIFNGSSVILEYSDPGTTHLVDLECYRT
ncbi:AN1-type zinc finger protein 1-like [Argonauta hians]